MRVRALEALVTFVALVGCTSRNEPPPPVVRSWGSATLIETAAGDAAHPQVAIDPSGNAMSVWQQWDATTINVWANRWTAGSGWGTAELLENDPGYATSPQIAMDTSGNAIAIWDQLDGVRYNIWARRYTFGSGWGIPELIETEDLGHATSPQIAIDAAGNAVAVWEQSDGVRYNIRANRYAAGSGWGTAQLIETDDHGDAFSPQVAVDPSGNAIAVWHQFDGVRDSIFSNRYTAGSGWGTAQLIETNDLGDAYYAEVAMDPDGNALAVWYQYDGSRTDIWSNRYTAGAGWGSAALIETDDVGNAGSPQIAMDSSGNAVAVWEQSDGIRANIWANRYAVGSGWGSAVLIETEDLGHATWPQVAVDGGGNAMAVWQQSDGIFYDIRSNRYTPGSGWGSTAALIETEDLGDAVDPQIAVDPSGDAIAVWQQFDGTHHDIWANRFQ